MLKAFLVRSIFFFSKKKIHLIDTLRVKTKTLGSRFFNNWKKKEIKTKYLEKNLNFYTKKKIFKKADFLILL